MNEADVEAAMSWCKRSGKWGGGTDRNFLDFVRMLQVICLARHHRSESLKMNSIFKCNPLERAPFYI